MKRILYLIVVIGLIIVNNGLIHSIVELWSKQNLVREAEIRFNKEKKENEKLKKELAYVQTNAFIENEARDKLFLVRPGESEVLISKELLLPKKSVNNSPPDPVWQQWLNLFSE